METELVDIYEIQNQYQFFIPFLRYLTRDFGESIDFLFLEKKIDLKKISAQQPLVYETDLLFELRIFLCDILDCSKEVAVSLIKELQERFTPNIFTVDTLIYVVSEESVNLLSFPVLYHSIVMDDGETLFDGYVKLITNDFPNFSDDDFNKYDKTDCRFHLALFYHCQKFMDT